MIQSRAHLESWRHLLETEIPNEMQAYLRRVTDGSVKKPWHLQAVQQCGAWTKRLNAMLADPNLVAFQARYPDWTTPAINTVISDLAAIFTAVTTHLASPQAASDLNNLQTDLAAHIRA
jgi:hypothetical protein